MDDVAAVSPLLSLVVATVGRTVELTRFLQSLYSADIVDVEVILVDQNEDDRVASLLAELGAPYGIQHIRQDRKSASSARNAGASVARGEWIGFPDDDCAMTRETVSLLRQHLTRTRCDVLSGRTVDGHGNRSVLRWPNHSCDIVRSNLRASFAESTMYIRRTRFQQVGGFDSLFGPGGTYGAEEAIDLLRRLWLAAPEARAVYAPEICFVHADASPYSNEAALQKTYDYARARGACFARHWRSSHPPRAAWEIAKHAIGSVVLRGNRRRSRVLSLRGYAEGFLHYRRGAAAAEAANDRDWIGQSGVAG